MMVTSLDREAKTAVSNANQQAQADELRFGFGENWRSFLSVLDDARIAESTAAIAEYLGEHSLAGRSFLDAGSGSGLSSLAAMRLGAARVHSFDYDPSSVACTRELRRRFANDSSSWQVEQGSVLDRSYLAKLGKFDVVYSWGVLHHTGAMWDAIDCVQELVTEDGLFYLSLYNNQGGWSRRWTLIKRTYNQLPKSLRPAFTLAVMAPREARGLLIAATRGEALQYVRRWAGKSADQGSRGMSVWYDMIDWVGGYPFEVSKPEEVLSFLRARGFNLLKMTTCGGGLGCNEFLFQRAPR